MNIPCPDFKPKEFGGLFQPFGFGALLGLLGTLLGFGSFGKMKTKARRPLRVPFEGSLGSREGLVKGCTTGGHNNIWCRLLQAIAVPLVESLFKGSAKGSPYTHLDCEKARCCQCLETRQLWSFSVELGVCGRKRPTFAGPLLAFASIPLGLQAYDSEGVRDIL